VDTITNEPNVTSPGGSAAYLEADQIVVIKDGRVGANGPLDSLLVASANPRAVWHDTDDHDPSA
jgi:hypothetical protein